MYLPKLNNKGKNEIIATTALLHLKNQPPKSPFPLKLNIAQLQKNLGKLHS